MGTQASVTLYHRTTPEKGREVLASGFKDSTAYFFNHPIWTGVWLSSFPPGSEDVSKDEVVLKVILGMNESELSGWEWTGEGRAQQEWLIPANILNSRATIELLEQTSYSTPTDQVGPDDARGVRGANFG